MSVRDGCDRKGMFLIISFGRDKRLKRALLRKR
jgi:hypothetical protein